MSQSSFMPFSIFFCSIATMFSSPSYAMTNPAATLCAQLNYKIHGESCVFPDGSSCDQWSFWRGTCGQKHHLCAHSQGQLTEKNNDIVCVIAGKDYHWTLRKMDSTESPWQVVLVPNDTKDASLK